MVLPTVPDIAVIGMSCRVAGANSPSGLWDLLESSKDVRSAITRFNSSGFYKPDGGPRKGLTNVRHAYVMEDGVDKFDNTFFKISPAEAEAMDPQQRLLLEIVYEAVENAGVPLDKFEGSDTSVYAGIFGNDYHSSIIRDVDTTPKYMSTGTSNSIAASRISYVFDLHGPSMVIDTACSSTMVGLHQAVSGLKARESRMAVVCGANLIISPDMFVHMSELGFLSPSGMCQSFDSAGDGYARGEGTMAMILKPLDDALHDGDPVRAVIRGTRINQDGRTKGISLPSSEAQKQNLVALYRQLQLSPGSIQYLEAHGTGTAAGDPLEMSAIDAVFGDSHTSQKLVVGSIKSSIGHLESCAALIGIIKTIEALERAKIPPQMLFRKINFDRICVPTKLLDWPASENGVRRAGVNSFGFGGTNGHAVLEAFDPQVAPNPGQEERPYLFKLSATSASSMRAFSDCLAEYIERQKPSLRDLAHTLLARRSTLRKVAFFSASSHSELITKLRTNSWNELTKDVRLAKKIAFVFTGQGAQWPEMGKHLLQASPLFRSVVAECDRTLQSLPDGPSWTIAEELSKPKQKSRLNKASFSQPICTALQVGLVEMWDSWGITPSSVVGHSSGEIGAAYAAGFLSLRDAIVIAFYRGLYLGEDAPVKRDGPAGAMCAIGLGEPGCTEILKTYQGRVALAAVNSPGSCTLSGDADAIQEVVATCGEKGIFCRALRVDMAYHSHHMLPLASAYEEAMAAANVSVRSGSPDRCNMFSSVTRRQLDGHDCTPSYWRTNMVSSVRFLDAVLNLAKNDRPDAFVELGPHPALKGPAGDALQSAGISEYRYFSSCLRGKPDYVSMLESAGGMVAAGLPVLTSRINATQTCDGLKPLYEPGRVLTDLPPYCWDHSASFWAESRLSSNVRQRQFPRHQLLGARHHDDMPITPSWRNSFALKDLGALVSAAAKTPLHASVAITLLMTLEAARQMHTVIQNAPQPSIRLESVIFHDPIPFPEDPEESVETQLSLQQGETPARWDLRLFPASSSGDMNWTHNCSCAIVLDQHAFAPPPIIRCEHDQGKLDHVLSFQQFMRPDYRDFAFSHDSATGGFSVPILGYENYAIDPSLLVTLLQIPEMLLLASGLPATYRLDKVDVLELNVGSSGIENGSFGVTLPSRSATEGRADVIVHGDHTTGLAVRGIHLQQQEVILKSPELGSLFYKRRVHPDITRMLDGGFLSVQEVMGLVTAKWPMCDIGTFNLDQTTFAAVLEGLQGLHSYQRPTFRSLNVVGDNGHVKAASRVRILDQIDGSLKLHLLIGKACDSQSAVPSLRKNGIACLQLEDDEDRAYFQDTFDQICDVAGLSGCSWVLGRPKALANGVVSAMNGKVFAPSKILPQLGAGEDSAFEGVVLDRVPLQQWMRSAPPSAQFDAIIVDGPGESILTAWSGHDILPWLQFVVDHVRTLLWVSLVDHSTPHSNLSGSLLKTLQSEYPSIKVANLAFKGEQDMDFIAPTIFAVHDDLIHGDSETDLIVQDNQIHIMRYQPDDELSASVGQIPPVQANSELSYPLCKYQLSLSGPKSTILLRERSGLGEGPKTGHVGVLVDETMVDVIDAVGFTTGRMPGQSGLGRFFAGRMQSSPGARNSSAVEVVGWHTNTHQQFLCVPQSQLCPIPNGVPAMDALTRYAAFATAMETVDGAIRARPGDRLHVDVSCVLGEALVMTASDLGISLVTAPENAETSIRYTNGKGLLLNESPISPHRLRITNISHIFAAARLGTKLTSERSTSIFPLSSHQAAFETAAKNPNAVAIAHPKPYGSVTGNALSWYPSKKHLFRGDGAYVIIGGSGGLGQHLCSWMVQNGAKRLFILSRRGIEAAGARETADTVQRLGGHLQVLTADATDSDSVQRVMESIRQVVPICGCLNLAMVLADSPFSTMGGREWDQALQVKVKSTWNLHQHTLQDSLDFFVMFSSITSICGNRAQANYATGNAFLNSMADYRQDLGLPGTAIALGAMSGIGVLADNGDLLRTLRQSGLAAVDSRALEKILEAAVLNSRSREHSLITVGLQMFETIDGKIQAEPDQTQIFWTEWPEFGLLMDPKFQDAHAAMEVSLLDRVRAQDPETALASLLEGFRVCLKNITGQDETSFDPAAPMSMYGLDSLNAVGVRYWFFKEIGIDLPVFDILGCTSISTLLQRANEKLDNKSSATEMVEMPQPVAHKDVAVRPLSHSQQRLWFLHNFLSDKTVYNLLLVCHITGPIDDAMFVKAWTVFMHRHEVLRSKIVDTGGERQQVPMTHMVFPLAVLETSEDRFEQQEQALTQVARAHRFDIEGGELIRGWLLKSPSRARFFLGSTHLAWDRSSSPTIFHETSTIYKSLIAGEDPEQTLDPVPFQFIDFTLWQNDWLNQDALVNPLTDYWATKLANIPDAVSLLPFAKRDQRPSMKEYAVGRVQNVLDAGLAAGVKEFCKRRAVTPFMFVTSALAALVSRLTGDEDVVIGITDGDRGHSAFEQLVGFTVNMLALRSHITGDTPFTAALEQFRTTCLEAYEHRAIPFDYLLQKLNITRSTSHSPIFQITVNYQVHGSFPECDFGDFKFTGYDHYNAKTQSDLALEVEESATGELLCGWDFDRQLYDKSGVLELASMYRRFIQGIVASDGAGAVNDLQIASSTDLAQIGATLQPPYVDEPSMRELNNSLFPVLFASAVSSNPGKTAAIDDQGSITYRELDARTNAVANTLLESGAQMRDRIGICCEQSVNLLIAVYGVLKAGCTYVPVDPDFPAERISWMIEDVGMGRFLVDDAIDQKSQQILTCGINPDDLYEISWISNQAEKMYIPALPRLINPSDNFCCIFTSGSTGRPKGIYLGHAQLRYQMHGYNKYIGERSNTAQPSRYSPVKMAETLVNRGITNCIFTPTQVKVMLNAPNRAVLSHWTHLRSLVLGGESVPVRMVKDFFALGLPRARFFNGYAPSETTVVNMLKELFPQDAERQDIPLNAPLFPARLHILDRNMQPLPYGVPGELYIGGPNVNGGYVHRPDATSTAFLEDPFAPESEKRAGFGKLYRTGDLFCHSRDGTVRALGRIGSDRQIKIRGMRVELEEIENAIWQVYEGLEEDEAPPLSLTTVTYHRKGDVDGLLTAYLAPSGGIEVPGEQQRLLSGYLRLALKATLPVYMLPAAYVFVHDLPRTVTGKVDHLTIASWPAPAERSVHADASTGPLSQHEALVASVWREVLQIPWELTASDDLFALGGHSLILLQIQRGVQEASGVTISLADMFANSSLRDMGSLVLRHLQASTESDSVSAIPGSKDHDNQAPIDWHKETMLLNSDWEVAPPSRAATPVAIVVTGATAMIGAHFAHLMLTSSPETVVNCIGVEAPGDDEARHRVLSSFSKWNLLNFHDSALDRLHVYRGTLSHPSLGLSDSAVHHLDKEADAIYHFDSDVSLFKNYDALRTTNIDSLHFLVDLARGSRSGKVKALHYLSSWGVPHLQSWSSTSLDARGDRRGEEELTNMTPGSENTLGYLKCRWVGEALLYKAARRGLPISIHRACMCASAPTSGRGLERTDINRRILEASLQTGLVPDFRSTDGGGMSWISVDFLVRSIQFLSTELQADLGRARIFNYQSENHVPYADLASLLGDASRGCPLKSVKPAEWFNALRGTQVPEMVMHAAVLEQWFEAGWTPVSLDGRETMDTLARKAGLVPPTVSRQLLLDQVVGNSGF